MKKSEQYAVKIMAQIQAMFDEECENHIDINDLEKDDNATEFVHAIANIAPAMIVGSLTGKKYDALEFNHMANRIAAQNMNFNKS